MALTVYRIDREGAERLLVLLHGYSAEQHHLAAYVPLVDPDERFTAVAPRALLDLAEGDGASWYERTEAGPEPASFQRAVEAVESLVGSELAKLRLSPEHCVIGGFSQGGMLSLAVAGRPGAPRYGGVWAMCCGLPSVGGFTVDFAAGAGTPALLQFGDRDPIVSAERADAVTAALRAGGWNVTLRNYHMAHSQRIEMMVDARDWLAKL